MDGGRSSETSQAPHKFQDMAHRIEAPSATPKQGWASRVRSGIGRVTSGLVRLNENASGIVKPDESQAADVGYVARQIATEMRGLPVTGGGNPFTETQLFKSAFYFTDGDLRNPNMNPVIANLERSVQALIQAGQMEQTADGFRVTDPQGLQDRARNWELKQRANSKH